MLTVAVVQRPWTHSDKVKNAIARKDTIRRPWKGHKRQGKFVVSTFVQSKNIR